MAKKKSKKVEEVEEIIEGEKEVSKPHKPHHWSNNGPRYLIAIEMDDSKPGTRHFKTFKECNELSEAKKICLESFEKENKTVIIYDRSEAGIEILRHERKTTI